MFNECKMISHCDFALFVCFLIDSDIEGLFICFWPFVYFLQRNVYIDRSLPISCSLQQHPCYLTTNLQSFLPCCSQIEVEAQTKVLSSRNLLLGFRNSIWLQWNIVVNFKNKTKQITNNKKTECLQLTYRQLNRQPWQVIYCC